MGDPLEAALLALRGGRVVAVATESSYGLLADVAQPSVLARLFEIKPREIDRGVPLLVPTIAAWTAVARPGEAARRIARGLWPGPVSIVTPAGPGLDRRVGVRGTVACRWAGPSPASELVERFGGAVTATSANPPGRAALVDALAVERCFGRAVAAGALHVVAGHAPGGPPSTLVTVVGRPRVLREGRVSRARVESVTGVRLG